MNRLIALFYVFALVSLSTSLTAQQAPFQDVQHPLIREDISDRSPNTGGQQLMVAGDEYWQTGFGVPGVRDIWHPDAVRAIASDESGNLYVGGNFTSAGNTQCSNIVMWDGSTWHTLGDGVDGYVQALTWDSDNDLLYVGGGFTNAGGALANHIAIWNPGTSTWSPLTDTGAATGVDGSINDMEFDASGNLYVGGSFQHAGSIAASRIAMWDGANWTTLGDGVVASVSEIELDGSNLFAGGSLHHAGGDPVSKVARWEFATSSWHSLGSDVFDGNVEALLLDGSDLYVGGVFSNIGSLSANGIAKWDSVASS